MNMSYPEDEKLHQLKQSEWKEQWEIFRDNELFLFNDWVCPNTLEDFTCEGKILKMVKI